MSNKYLEHMKERVDKYGIDKMVFTDTETALLAIAVELQTLNESLSSIDYSLNSLTEEAIHRGVTVNQG